ncbi:hypothetical protein TNCV_3964491 [Trichonephila clavipes]|nr:hypothetical protein TNCV_3964491 [Trichonephila clavipes]
MPRVRRRNAYQHVSDLDKGQIVTYPNSGSSYHSIAASVGREPMIVAEYRIDGFRTRNPGSSYNIKIVASVFGGIVMNAHWQHSLVIVILALIWRDAVVLAYTFTRSLANRKRLWLLSDWIILIRQSLRLMSCNIALQLHENLCRFMPSKLCLTHCPRHISAVITA